MANEYQVAINHYKQLKESFLKRIQQQANFYDNKLENSIEEDIFSQIEKTPISKDFKRAQQLENIVESLYASIFDSTQANQNQENEAMIQNIRNNADLSIEQLKKQIKNYLNISNNNITLEQAIRKSFSVNGSSQLRGGSTEDIYNRLVGVFAQKIKDNTKSVLSLLQAQRYQIAGYYHELAAFQATRKLSQHLKTTHIGSENVAADIVYTTAKAKDPIEQYIKELQRLQKSYSVTETIPLNNDFYNSIQVFGNQVKSWNLNKNKARIQGYSISSQATLRKSLPEWATQMDSVQFFKKNPYAVISTFGPLNVMYFTGHTRWWTCDLIETAINSKYRLMFNVGEKTHKLTNIVKLDQKAWHWSRLYLVT